ncbi:MAG: quinolinate synthase [Phycisphaerales bacterium]|nr:quinolinate synthase [Phycisphaerales bacterium]
MLWQPELPAKYREMSDDALGAAISQRRLELGSDLLVLGHHYQRDDVVRHADFTGDSLKLSQLSSSESERRGVKWIVFCGVHFMAETADILNEGRVAVILPDLSAGCSMADMADAGDAEDALNALEAAHRALGAVRVIPITYVNSSAAVKALVGSRGGACCTSSNAERVMEWALAGGNQPLSPGERVQILFLPDQHLGRNTAKRRGFVTDVDAMAGREADQAGASTDASGAPATSPKSQVSLWQPRLPSGGLTTRQMVSASIVLWAGHCSVHKLFRLEHVEEIRQRHDGTRVVVHPECSQDVVDAADLVGSTEFIIKVIEAAAPDTSWAVGTEFHLVERLARAATKRGITVHALSDCQCMCTTMFRIDQAHLLWTLDNLADGRVVNQVKVSELVRAQARLAIDRMMANATPLTASID